MLSLIKSFPLKYILIALVISNLVMLGLWQYEKIARKDAVYAKEIFAKDVDTAGKIKAAENAIKDKHARDEIKRINDIRLEALRRLDLANVDRDKLKIEVKNAYAKINETKTVLDRTYANFNERLRLEQSRSGNTATQEPTTPEYTQAWYERDRTAIGNIIKACQLTTIDLNTCSAWVDAACDKVGCEE